MDLDTALKSWNRATGEMSWGVQRVLKDALTLVKDGKVHMVYGADYRDGRPCLINAVRPMLAAHGESPSAFAPQVVRTFDAINSALVAKGINAQDTTDTKFGYVSPLAAEVLLRNFGSTRPEPELKSEAWTAAINQAKDIDEKPFIEPSDATLAAQWLASMEAPAPQEKDRLADAGDPTAQFLKSLNEYASDKSIVSNG